MSCNCTNYFDLGKVPTCDSEGIKFTDLTAPVMGIYTLKVEALGFAIKIQKAFDQDEELTFSTVDLNENMDYTAKLYDTTGAPMLFNDADCFNFTTQTVYTLT